MRVLKKIVTKFVTLLIMVALLGAVMRYARPLLMKSAGLPTEMPTTPGKEGVHFSSEESDLMATVFKSAIRLLTGSASRKELAGELSTKLYAGRADAGTMSELGIELVQPGASPSASGIPPGPGRNPPIPGGLNAPAKAATPPSPGERAASSLRDVFLTRLQKKALANPELAFAPVVLTGMLVVHGIKRRRRSPLDALVLPDMSKLLPSDSEPYEMTHAVHALKAEDFELLVALVYQRQGYRVSMPAGLSGGRGGDFTLQRKSERLLVQCKNMRQDHRLPIERVRELHEAATAAGATRGLFVASCGFTWDARNFAKAKGMTVINARTLDALITEARESEDEDLLAVPKWAPKFMAKVKLTPPMCPTCEAEMEQLNASGGTVWVCSQRPDCRGRRNARNYQTAAQPAVLTKLARSDRPASSTKPTAGFAKITRSVQFTKLTRPVNFTRLTSLAKFAVPAKAGLPAAPPNPTPAAAPAAPGTPVKPDAAPAASVRAASKPGEEPAPPARLLAAFPTPKRLTAWIREKSLGLKPSPTAGTSAPAPARSTPSANAPAPSRTRSGNPR